MDRPKPKLNYKDGNIPDVILSSGNWMHLQSYRHGDNIYSLCMIGRSSEVGSTDAIFFSLD
ncbi:hypothetical protein FRX31_030431 [Thalictrum thalictroides]|uniref:Uncharacterized protein n=1 Tax=Thalictrum thalictroides TaxID=46969 RepID=A0A7J6V700_THATH|nr:hypothetical protein FRX31_030431 [Thalictrum thalictroides]